MPPASLAKDPPQQPECMWEVGNYSTHDAIRAWEFQAQPHRHMVSDANDRSTRRRVALNPGGCRDVTPPPPTPGCIARALTPTLPPPPRRTQVRDRERAIERVEKLLRQLSADPHSDVTWVPGSRWMAIFQETAFQVGVGGCAWPQPWWRPC
jgi:hypothetical protein